MRDSGAKGANYFQKSEVGGRRAEIRGQKPKERTRIARIKANSIRFGFDIHGGRVGRTFDQGLGFAQKDVGFIPSVYPARWTGSGSHYRINGPTGGGQFR